MDDAELFIAEASERVRPLLARIHALFMAAGCDSYVKTIYIGYEVRGKLVAASYGHAHNVEVALALPEDHIAEQLKDATHLTWRTMPVLVEIKNRRDLVLAEPLFSEAVERVVSGAHDVVLPIERFMGRDKRLSGSRKPRP